MCKVTLMPILAPFNQIQTPNEINNMSATNTFIPLHIAILTISDTRNDDTDSSGNTLVDLVLNAGHHCATKVIVPDDIYQIRAVSSQWIADPDIDVIITTGGTGFAGRDSTPEAMQVLFDKTIEGFGELFRQQSFAEIGTSTIQSRCLAGLANHTVIFCLPGSTGACRTGWSLIAPQLDATHRPCNFVAHLRPVDQCTSRG
jgi:molybdopterin adenylyltransferase